MTNVRSLLLSRIFIDEIKDCLTKGENIYLRGFGTFELKTRAAKVARNIRAKESVHVPEHSIPAFKAGAELKEAVYNVKAK